MTPDLESEIDPVEEVRVESGHPSSEDAAAVIAVVSALLREGGVVDDEPEVDGWTRSVRSPSSSIVGAVWSSPLR